jgi:hypothetical protein
MIYESDICSQILKLLFTRLPMRFRNRQLPEIYSGQFDLFFDGATRTLVVEYDLPELESIPTVKSIRYSSSKDEFESIVYKENFIQGLFDNLVYQTGLGVIHWILASDGERILRAVVFNGWITYINRANGNDTTACIASLHVTRDEFSNINLLNVDAKACFRALKGVSSPQVHSLTPVKPITLRLAWRVVVATFQTAPAPIPPGWRRAGQEFWAVAGRPPLEPRTRRFRPTAFRPRVGGAGARASGAGRPRVRR